MKKFPSFFIILSLVLSLSGVLNAQQSATTKIAVYSTSVVKKNAEQPLQIGMVEIRDGGFHKLECTIEFPGNKSLNYTWENLDEKYSIMQFEFPKLSEHQNVKIRISNEGNIVFNETVQFNPPKTWKIYDVQVSHHDLGYADYYHMMRRDVREMGIEMAMDFARQTDAWPKESQFHWTVETSEPMIQYLSRQPKAVLDELSERISSGQFALGGIHNSVMTEHMSYEAMARHFYTPNRYVCDWFNTEPSKTALNTDVVGFSRALALYSKEADMPYFMFGRNSAIKEFDKAEDDAAFYWQSPDKDSKMTLFKIWHYYSPDRFTNYDVQEVAAISRSYELHKNYPYDCLLSEDSFDFGLPQFENVEGIKKWNESYSNPVLISGTFDMYFDDLNSQQVKETFKVYDKDAPNAWADMDATDVEYANKARRLYSRLPSVEKWATIASAVSAGTFPWIDIYQAYHGLLMWAEHTNGAYSEGKIFTPTSLDDQSAANACYYELEQEMHRDLIRESEFFTEKAAKLAGEQLLSQITTESKNTLVVNNPLVRKRSDVVRFKLPDGKGLNSLIDNVTGKEVPFQFWEDGDVLFFAGDVPSLGYKTYTLEMNKKPGTVKLEKETGAPSIENDYYKIDFDEKTGAISSIYDKVLERELVDRESEFKLNEYYYERFNSGNYPDGSTPYHPEKAIFKTLNGKLAQMVVSEVTAEGCENIIQKVIIYKDAKRIDFEVLLDKTDSERTLDDYRTYSAKGKEALFYCLPLDIPDFTIKHELAGGIMEPIEDQFPGSSTDFYVIQNFSDISNDKWGVTIATREPNMIEYGKPRPAIWSTGDDFEKIMEKAGKSHFYLYLLNNMFFTNIRQTQPGPKFFSWSIRSHLNDWNGGKAYHFGRDIANPFTTSLSSGKNQGTLPATQHAFVEMDNEDVICTTVKPAEINGEGYILRFVEASGKEAELTLDVHFIEKIEKANFTNLVELDRDYTLELIGKNSLKFNIPAFGLRTIRVIPVKIELPFITNLQAISSADRQVELSWDVSGASDQNVAYYQIFRSTEAGFDPGLSTYVANTDKTRFTDQPTLHIRGWQNNYVEPETNYHYRVIPVGTDNRKGKASGTISVQTIPASQKDLEPAQVLGLVVTPVSSITDHNYVGLYFYTNIESDVNQYNLYRSEEKDFTPDASNRIDEIDVSEEILHVTPHMFGEVKRQLKEYNRQLFVDEEVEPFTTYYYKVAAEDDAGQQGGYSHKVSITTAGSKLKILGETSFREKTEIQIETAREDPDAVIHYTLDGSTPTRSSEIYTSPITIDIDIIMIASLFLKGKEQGIETAQAEFKKSNNYEVDYRIPHNEKWPGTGEMTLIDNFRGEYFASKLWQGWEAKDMDVVIDLKKDAEIESVSTGFLHTPGNWIFFPEYVEVFLSENGEEYSHAGTVEIPEEWKINQTNKDDLTVTFPKTRVRYVRVFVKSVQYIPVWHEFAGNKAWLFVDEIVIK